MSDTRRKDVIWNCGKSNNTTYDGAQLAVLMDIRDELQKLNRVFACVNFVRIPQTLARIVDNTTPKKKRKYRRRSK